MGPPHTCINYLIEEVSHEADPPLLWVWPDCPNCLDTGCEIREVLARGLEEKGHSKCVAS